MTIPLNALSARPYFLLISSAIIALAIFIFALAMWLGGPGAAPPMPSINDPFKSVDFSHMPPLKNYQGADGVKLFYREYGPQGDNKKGSAVLVHGSSASSSSMHPMAQALAATGLHVFALDIRGHGASGVKGHIDYIGQLESDLKDFVDKVKPAHPSTLIGFSSGGGFVLRIAASDMQTAFDHYLLLSPFLGPDAPNYRPNSGGWVSVGVPRIVALLALNKAGIRYWNHLPVTRFALSDEARKFLTPEYDFNLAMNFSVHSDYLSDIRNAKGRVSLLAGDADEAFQTQELQGIVQRAGKDWPVQLLPGIGHIPLTLDKAALTSVVEQVIH